MTQVPDEELTWPCRAYNGAVVGLPVVAPHLGAGRRAAGGDAAGGQDQV